MTNTERNKAAYITTFTGKELHIFEPALDSICVEDIAHALSFMPRFTGHTIEFYSVSQHSTILADLFLQKGQIELAQFALHHDSAEFAVCDIPSPIKYMPSMSGYKAIEKKLQKCIYEKFGLDYLKNNPDAEIIESCGEPMEVKLLDTKLVNNEARDLLRYPPDWSKGNYVRNLRIVPVTSARAEKDFLKMHNRLFKEQNEKNQIKS